MNRPQQHPRPPKAATKLKGKYYARRLDKSPTLSMRQLAILCGVSRQAVSKAVGLYREASIRDANPSHETSH